jgi:hypothetical protein
MAGMPRFQKLGNGTIWRGKATDEPAREDARPTEIFRLYHCQKWILLGVLAISVGLLTTGCQTYRQKNKVIVYWHAGDLGRAEAEAAKRANKSANGKDAIIWR